MVTEKDYNEITSNLSTYLKDVDRDVLDLIVPEYKSFLTRNGTMDKRKKYFKVTIKLRNNTGDRLSDIGEAMSSVGNFMDSSSSNERIYLVSEIMPFYNNITIVIKFISYVQAAKALLMS
jgi:hypothetical protein